MKNYAFGSVHAAGVHQIQTGTEFTFADGDQSATIVSARAMGVEKEVGTVAAGKRADLISA